MAGGTVEEGPKGASSAGLEPGAGSITGLARDTEALLVRLAGHPAEGQAGEIRRLLESRLQDIPWEGRRGVVERLRDYFREPVPRAVSGTASLVGLAKMILGDEAVGGGAVDGEDLMERLRRSMTTVFETLNEIVRALHSTIVLGEGTGPDETIRMLIRDRLTSEIDSGDLPIQAYLDHIRRAFHSAQQAFREAVDEKFKEVFVEISPERLSREFGEKGLRVGPLYKAALFDLYGDKYRRLSQFAQQGLLTQETMLAFERKFGDKMRT